MLVAALSKGIGPRLTFTEMALEECVFKRVDVPEGQERKKPAMVFVMGHTHEPVLQEIVVLESPSAVPPSIPPTPTFNSSSGGLAGRNVQVSVRFIQVDVVESRLLGGNSNLWKLNTTLGRAGVLVSSLAGEHTTEEITCTLFDVRPLLEEKKIPLPGEQVLNLNVPMDAGATLSFAAEFTHAIDSAYWANSPYAVERERRWKYTENGVEKEHCHKQWVRPVVFSMQIPALSWGGTQTVEVNAFEYVHYTVTFELIWGNIVG